MPRWKNGPSLTAADRLHELALQAQVHPHKFKAFVLCRMGEGHRYERHNFGTETLAEQMGLYEMGKFLCWKESVDE